MRQTPDVARVAQAFRLRFLLTRPDAGTATLAETLSGGLHVGSPPDNAQYPYGAFRVLNVRQRDIDAPLYRADVELQLFARPRTEAAALQAATDAAVEAVVGWSDLPNGIRNVGVRDSDVLPPFSEHADPEVVTSRSVFTVDLFPAP